MTATANHFDHLLELVETEREAEREENQRKLERLPVQEREALGKTVTRLVVTSEDVGIGGHALWALSRPSHGEEISPFQAFNQGDVVMLSYLEGSETRKLRGTLYDVDQFEITVALDAPAPENPPAGKCQLDELGSEATYKRMKKALEAVQKGDKKPTAHLRDLFMGKGRPEIIDLPALEFFNPHLNPYQQEAVRRALAAREVALVHGPPGTGKTTVLIEIIRQSVEEGYRVLASAPSNIAVDNMLEKLLDAGLRVVRTGHPARILDSLRHATLSAQLLEHEGQDEIRALDQRRELLVRQRARRQDHNRRRSWEEARQMDAEIEALWKQARDMEYGLSRRILAEADVVLATHGGISKQLLSKPFDLLIMDEASQATEPLSWIPITQAKKVVFAGDPLQLPPTIYSEKARKEGLGLTLFERLQKILPKEAQTLLRVQYRMHETIMGFSSREFYKGALVADESVRRHTAMELPHVKKTVLTQKPLVYIDTVGTGFEERWNDLLESRENEGEAKLAAQLARELHESGIPTRHIAILTPYVAQARLLRTILNDRHFEVDSIDGFQGREKEVAIISLVRSNEQGEIGFLDDTRRMNVAMTRARRLLIVLGDSGTISRHKFYDDFLTYVAEHDAHHSAWEWLNA
jgi:ATP-dependent RNA/DNA helicase IGHMBP2